MGRREHGNVIRNWRKSEYMKANNIDVVKKLCLEHPYILGYNKND
ncbi:hypothetical protein PAJ34TS1_10490 [Paenibacillus azoreducens]